MAGCCSDKAVASGDRAVRSAKDESKRTPPEF
jgi:hypothetical protein